VDGTLTIADALTIDELIGRLERMRLESSEGGETPVVMSDGEPVCRTALMQARIGWMPSKTVTTVVLTDRYEAPPPAPKSPRKRKGE
jgi:hypothetical protein